MLQVTFRHMSASDALRSLAVELLDKLHVRAHGAERCHLVVDLVSRQPGHKPAQFTVHMEVSFGLHEAQFHASSTADDASDAIREVFASIERQLHDRRTRLHGNERATSAL
ncbi:MAG: Sigma 54 modulation protein / ribosomal protein [Myxococcaceae bacterium]|nr:Sigma 54 modulation protein / ribosomal protein [Myxococcaceae bacterium]